MTGAGRRPPPDGERRFPVIGRLDLRLTLGIHQRGRGDPALRFEVSGSAWRASRTPAGPVTLLLEQVDGSVRVRAWGPGTAWALAQADQLIGLDDDPASLVARDPAVAAAQRRLAGLRIGRTARVIEALVPAILEQKITGEEARRAYRGLVKLAGEGAPGGFGLRLPPDPAMLARLPYHAFHPVGIERRRASLIRAVCHEADRLERLGQAAALPGAEEPERTAAYRALQAFPGIGPWTAAEVGIRAFGDPDAVSVGDFHLPSMVSWALAGEPRGSDERMLELLEPYRGQRGRVLRLLGLAGMEAPRRGPRMPTRRIDRL